MMSDNFRNAYVELLHLLLQIGYQLTVDVFFTLREMSLNLAHEAHQAQLFIEGWLRAFILADLLDFVHQLNVETFHLQSACHPLYLVD